MGDVPNPWSASGLDLPYTELNRIVETLTNLLYLIQHDADDAAEVRYFVHQAELCLERARVIVREQMRGYSPN